MLFMLISLSWARPSGDEILSQIERYNALTDLDVPTLSAEQRTAISNGEVVKLIEKGSGASGKIEAGKVRAYYITNVSRDQLWLAFQDGHLQIQESRIFQELILFV